MITEVIMIVISTLGVIFNAGCFMINYLSYKKQAATTTNSDGLDAK